jgi:ppGpp synthetase/RelA/SpoT-type nucleotidyltranferase
MAYKAEGNSKAMAKATKLQGEVERRAKIANADKIERRKAQQSLLSKAMKKIENDDLLNQIWDLVPQSVKLAIAQD